MVWIHNENWMVTGDDGGFIKYWQTNMNNVKENKSAHRESEEHCLEGHGWNVMSVDWHPTKYLFISRSKDNVIKLWIAKTRRVLSNLHGHKNTVLSIKWNQNGNWVLVASKDQTIKLYDIQTLKELESYHGHCKDVTAVAWHPFHEEFFVSGSLDGYIIHWLVGHEVPQVEIHYAHESVVWDLTWHLMGHILYSGSNDNTTKFWCRNRTGDPSRDKYTGYVQGASDKSF